MTKFYCLNRANTLQCFAVSDGVKLYLDDSYKNTVAASDAMSFHRSKHSEVVAVNDDVEDYVDDSARLVVFHDRDVLTVYSDENNEYLYWANQDASPMSENIANTPDVTDYKLLCLLNLADEIEDVEVVED